MLRLDGQRRAPFFDEGCYTENTRETYEGLAHRIERAALAAGFEPLDAPREWITHYFVTEAIRSIGSARKQLPAVAYVFRINGREHAFPYDEIADLLHNTSPCARDSIAEQLATLPRRVRRRARAFADKLLKRTRSAHSQLNQGWEVYARHYGINPLRATVSDLKGYIAFYARTHRYSSCANLCAALSNYFRAAGVEDLTRDKKIRDLLVLKAREDAESSEYRPLYADDLRDMVISLGPAPLDVRDRCVCLLNYYGAFFTTELQALDRNVVIRSRYVLLNLDGRWVKIGGVNDPELDVRRWLAKWVAQLPPGPGPLFPRMRRGEWMPVALSENTLCRIVKRAARRANITAPHPTLALRKGFAIRSHRAAGPVQTAAHMRLKRTSALGAHVRLDRGSRSRVARLRRRNTVAALMAPRPLLHA